MGWLMRNRHLIMACVWAGLAIPTLVWWKDSVLWVAFLSLYANFASEVGAHHGIKTEKMVDEDQE